MLSKQPDITVFFLPRSRTIRTVWLLEELGVPYKLEIAPDGQDAAALQAFHERTRSPMARYPTLHDGDLVLHESGAITECALFVPRALVEC
jgi:glutathione S-transferase